MVLTEMSDRQIQDAMGVRLSIAGRGENRQYVHGLRPQERARNMRAQGKLFLVTPGMQLPSRTRRKAPMFLRSAQPQSPVRNPARVFEMPMRQEPAAPRQASAFGGRIRRIGDAILDWLNPRVYPAR